MKLSVISTTVCIIFNCLAFAEIKEDRKEIYEQLNLFGEVFDRVRSTHVESVKSKDLIRKQLKLRLKTMNYKYAYFLWLSD